VTFVKGQSGNPRGRPRNQPEIAPALRTLLREKDPVTGATNALAIADALFKKARAGDIEAIKVVLDRIDGKLSSVTEITGGQDAIRIEVAFVDGSTESDA
jgi:hypothetical protein